jgi:hypothetical protein
MVGTRITTRIGGFYNASDLGFIVNGWNKVIVKRVDGQLTARVNGLLAINITNNVNITTADNPRLMAVSTNAEGTTHSTYFDGTLFEFGYNNGQDIDIFEANFNKVCASKYGL